jgi:hypothetical protein
MDHDMIGNLAHNTPGLFSQPRNIAENGARGIREYRKDFLVCHIASLLLTPSKSHPIFNLRRVRRTKFELWAVLLDLTTKKHAIHWVLTPCSRHCQRRQQSLCNSELLKLRQSQRNCWQSWMLVHRWESSGSRTERILPWTQ